MDSEILKWIEKAPKNISLSGSKTSYYNGELQLKLFFKMLEKNNYVFINPNFRNFYYWLFFKNNN